MRPATQQSLSRYLVLGIVLLTVYLVSHRLRPSRAAGASSSSSAASRWTLEAQLGARLAALPPATTVPFLLFVDASLPASEAYLARTLASLRRADGIAGTPLLFLYDPAARFAAPIAAVIAGVDFAPALALTSPPAEDPARAAYQLLRLGLSLPFRGAVWLPIGLQVSQDARDFAAWCLEQLERDGTLRSLFGVNLYYAKGQGFGGSERYTLATEELGLQPWGAVLPRAALPLVRQTYAGTGAAWQAALGEAVRARGLRVATPRISRSRPVREFANPPVGGEAMYIPVSDRGRARGAAVTRTLGLPAHPSCPRVPCLACFVCAEKDHPLDYKGRTFLLVPRH